MLHRIYDAALSPELWPDVLGEIADQFGARGAFLKIVDGRRAEGGFETWSRGYDDTVMRAYFDLHERHEKWGRLLVDPPGRLVRPEDLWIDLEEFANSPASQWWNATCDVHYRLAARLKYQKPWLALFSIQFPASAGIVPETRYGALSKLLPHIAQALEIASPIQLMGRRLEAMSAVFERLRLGVCFLAADGRIQYRNREADRILAGSAVTLGPEDRPWIQQKKLRTRLDEMLAEATRRPLDPRHDGRRTLIVPPEDGGAPILVHVSALPEPASFFGGDSWSVVLFLVDTDGNRLTASAGILAELFGLTQAESEVCRLLAEGRSTGEVAERRGVSVHTVKSQIKSVLQKTQSMSRTDLIRLVLAVDPPFLDID